MPQIADAAQYPQDPGPRDRVHHFQGLIKIQVLCRLDEHYGQGGLFVVAGGIGADGAGRTTVDSKFVTQDGGSAFRFGARQPMHPAQPVQQLVRADFDGNDGVVGDELRGSWRVLGIKVLESGGFPGAVNADESGYHREILFLKNIVVGCSVLYFDF